MLSLLLLAILLTSSHASLSPRSTTDNCAFLSNFDLTAALNANLGITIPDIFGDINTCICSSGVPNFINTNAASQIAVSLTSVTRVINAINTIIIAVPGSQECIYPDHVAPTCQSNNVCGYTCGPPFTSCQSGACELACPSSVPPPRRSLEQQIIHNTPCPTSWDVCRSLSSSRSFECIDTQNTLDSCGGCLYPTPGKRSRGKDCSAISGVDSVSCQRGKCHVESCRKGLKVTNNGQSCR